MSNSPLVSYTKISPNRNSPRNHAIDTITIHCVVGQCSVETIGNVFAPTSRQASSNYGVGPDGRIGMYCEERDRSWCTSSGANDHRAITIEVASDTTHPYAVKPAAYKALIELVADICKRNGIKRLVWSTDKAQRVGHLNGCNMTVHRDYANKACPGDYLYSRHGEIAAEVNKRLGATATATPATQPTAAATAGAMTDAEVFAYFKAQGFTDAGAAGVMGNLYAESGLVAINVQSTGNTKLGMTDAQYTAAVDGGTYSNFVRDGYGYGIAQWTYWTRKQALLDFTRAAGVSVGHKRKQCEFIMHELKKGYPGLVKTLQTAKTVREASDAFLLQFERPANQSEAAKVKRAGYGQGYFDKYASSTATQAPAPAKPATFTPYLVRVKITDLNIRKGPGTNYPVKGIITPGTYTIVQESTGQGAALWGKLKSGAGWICLGYTEKI